VAVGTPLDATTSVVCPPPAVLSGTTPATFADNTTVRLADRKLGQLLAIDTEDFLSSTFGQHHQLWDSTRQSPITWAGINATLENAFALGKAKRLPGNAQLLYKQFGSAVEPTAGPQSAPELIAELTKISTDPADALSAVLVSADLLDPALAQLAKQLREILARPVTMNLYLSAPSSTALNPHTDEYDVFVVQLQGAKTWQVCTPKSSVDGELTEADAAEAAELAKSNPGGCSSNLAPRADDALQCRSIQLPLAPCYISRRA
jgi:hypothetical protein